MGLSNLRNSVVSFEKEILLVDFDFYDYDNYRK